MTQRELETLFIEPSPTIAHSTIGDFCAELSGNKLYVPQDIYAFLNKSGMQTVEDFLSLVHSFLSSFAAALQWNHDDVDRAKQKLVTMLEGNVDDRFLHPEPARQYSFGALRPTRHPAQNGYILPPKPGKQ